MKALRIWWLKRKARRAWSEYHAILDGYDCGAALAWWLSARLRKAAVRFNDAADALGRLDPTAPTARL